MMSDDSKLDQLFQNYRAACPEVEPSTNFMPNLWQRIEARHSFGFVFRNVARVTMTACAALCLLLVFMNFASPFRDRIALAPNYTDVLMAEHTAENTDFTEALHVSASDEEAPAAHNR
jgi:Na+-transporting NADH:ubiquinone oxidoreductase subunit NqrB